MRRVTVQRWSLRPFAVLSMIVAILIVNTGTVNASHAWSTYHWATTTKPFTLQVGDNMTASDWKSYLGIASADWSKTDGGNPLRTKIVPGASSRKCSATSGRVEVCNGNYGQNGWLGLAQIWLSNGHIVQGTAKMNDTYFSTATYNNPNEKLHVVCQEVGHTFGLGHQSTDGSSQNTCMDYFSNTGANATSTLSTHPNAHDYDQLAIIYGHNDGYTSYTLAAAAPVLGLGGATGADGQGTPAGASKARGSWYVQDLGNGRALVTHVYWAD